MKYQYDFLIAGISVQWNSNVPIAIGERYLPFISEEKKEPEIIYEIHMGHPERDVSQERILLNKRGYQISETDTCRYRTFFCDCTNYEKVITLVRGYNSGNVYQLYIPPDAQEMFLWEESWSYYMAFEEMLYTRGRVMLHSSYVETKQGAILFTGPSGAGKSTQADLWSHYGEGTVMNGDRTILYEQDGMILASGSPCAGTSGIYRNYQSPVKAIVVLEQGEENHLERLRGKDCLMSLIRESSFMYMDEAMKKNQMELLLCVGERIPVYRYRCTKDKSAVEVLQERLEKEQERSN